jgi:hypothetical protein
LGHFRRLAKDFEILVTTAENMIRIAMLNFPGQPTRTTLPLATLAAWLIATAGRVQLRKYRKHPRGPKKPPVQRTHDPRRPHVSVARLLAPRQQAV